MSSLAVSPHFKYGEGCNLLDFFLFLLESGLFERLLERLFERLLERLFERLLERLFERFFDFFLRCLDFFFLRQARFDEPSLDELSLEEPFFLRRFFRDFLLDDCSGDPELEELPEPEGLGDLEREGPGTGDCGKGESKRGRVGKGYSICSGLLLRGDLMLKSIGVELIFF